jgi:hypothetical protein
MTKVEAAGSAVGWEEVVEFFGGHDFELGIGAVCGGFVGAPAAEVGEVAEAVALHVLVGDFDDELGAECLPGEVLAAGPSGFCAGHAGACGVGCPACPRMVFE